MITVNQCHQTPFTCKGVTCARLCRYLFFNLDLTALDSLSVITLNVITIIRTNEWLTFSYCLFAGTGQFFIKALNYGRCLHLTCETFCVVYSRIVQCQICADVVIIKQCRIT